MYWTLNHNLLLLPILVASLCFGQGPGDKENIFNGGLALDGIPIPKSVSTTNGVSGKALLLDGDTFVAVPGTEAFGHGSNSSNGFSITLWFNVHELGRGQQMIISKNRYKLGQREWGVMVDKDDTVRLYARHGSKWETGDTGYTPVPGSWVHLHLQRAPGQYYLYLNHSKVGSAAATADAPEVLPRTATRIAVGGVDDPLRQGFHGAIDELRLFDTKQDWVPLAPRPKSWPAPHHLPEPPPPLWSPDATLPISKELNPVAGARFHVIKAWEPKTDGYKWLHGLSLAHHKGKLYASFGHNKGAENTASEEARYQVSSDDGRTWSAVRTLDTGTEAPDLAVSHGVFHVHAGKLYAFHGAFSGKMRDIHTRLYLNDESGAWENKGVVLKGGFWRMVAGSCPGSSAVPIPSRKPSPPPSPSQPATTSRTGNWSLFPRRRTSACGASPPCSSTARTCSTSPATEPSPLLRRTLSRLHHHRRPAWPLPPHHRARPAGREPLRPRSENP